MRNRRRETPKIITYRFPRGDLCVVPYSGDVLHAARLLRDESALGDEKRARCARALRVVFNRERRVNMLRVRTETREWRQHDAVSERRATDLDWREQLGDGHRVSS